MHCFFVSDLHGKQARYEKLFHLIAQETPDAVFIGGDILPGGMLLRSAIDIGHRDFVNDFLAVKLQRLLEQLETRYPRIFLIMGNDDPRCEEAAITAVGAMGLWEYIHNRIVQYHQYSIYGYSYVPPSPFQLKDWERYDVSRYVDPDCSPPEAGIHTVPVSERELRYATIANDLKVLSNNDNLHNSLFLFHSAPYDTKLDQIKRVHASLDHAPLDNHIGSIAIRRLIETRQPIITLHGHVHESARITGSWNDQIGKTLLFSAAHDGRELALVRFDPSEPANASRELIDVM